MTNEQELLEALKGLHKAGYNHFVFVQNRGSDHATVDYSNGYFAHPDMFGDGLYRRIPSESTLERKIVEIITSKQQRLSILYYGIWQYDITNYYDGSYQFTNPDRKIAAILLLTKLLKEK